MRESGGEPEIWTMRSETLSGLVRAHQRLVEHRERQRAGLDAPDPAIDRELDAVAERIMRLLSNPRLGERI